MLEIHTSSIDDSGVEDRGSDDLLSGFHHGMEPADVVATMARRRLTPVQIEDVVKFYETQFPNMLDDFRTAASFFVMSVAQALDDIRRKRFGSDESCANTSFEEVLAVIKSPLQKGVFHFSDGRKISFVVKDKNSPGLYKDRDPKFIIAAMAKLNLSEEEAMAVIYYYAQHKRFDDVAALVANKKRWRKVRTAAQAEENRAIIAVLDKIEKTVPQRLAPREQSPRLDELIS